MSNFKCNKNEKELGRWTTNFIPHGGGRYTGQLVVTDQRVVFHAKFDTSLQGVIGDLFFINTSETGHLIAIPKEHISEIATKISFLNKRILLNTNDGQSYIVDNGMLPVENILHALSKMK